MAAGRLYLPQHMPALDDAGDPLPGAKIYWYLDLTDDLQATYTTSALATANANPVVADDVGVFPAMWADRANTFTAIVTDADGVPVSPTYSGISASIDGTLASVALAEAAQTAAEAAQTAAEAAAADLAAAVASATASAAAAVAAAATAVEIAGFDPALYQLRSEKNAANGYAGLTASTLINDAQLTGAPISTDQQAALDLKQSLTQAAADLASAKGFAVGAAATL